MANRRDEFPQLPSRKGERHESGEGVDPPKQTLASEEMPWRPGVRNARRTANPNRRSARIREQQSSEVTQASPQTASNKRKRSEAVEAEASSSQPKVASKEAEDAGQQKNSRQAVPSDWEPPLVIGASLGDNLSRLEEADRRVLQWEAIIENARQTQVGADLSSFERKLAEVVQERDEMEEIEENLLPYDELESTKQERIGVRLVILRGTLERVRGSPGETNVVAVINGYNEGRIERWDKWLLFYAGCLVDVCDSYEDFTKDRESRLDSYFEKWGPGWLWYEPPLSPKGNVPPHQLFAATWAQPSRNVNKALGGGANAWQITMAFRRVRTFHSRTASSIQIPIEVDCQVSGKTGDSRKRDEEKLKAERRNSRGKTLEYQPKYTNMPDARSKRLRWAAKEDLDGPRCFFLMHLDSGASIPCLYGSDIYMLGIDPETYPPQTEMPMSTANGTVRCPLYELRVDVCKHNGNSLVGSDPVWPEERRELGGIIPVAILPGPSSPPKGSSKPLDKQVVRDMWRRGEDVSEKALAERQVRVDETRLSGLLPFQVCYTASAPGKPFWFGETEEMFWEQTRCPVNFDWNLTGAFFLSSLR